GYLQADDYAGYHGVFRGKRVYHAACWAHARRGFFEIALKDATPGLAQQALDWDRPALSRRARDSRANARRTKTRAATTNPAAAGIGSGSGSSASKAICCPRDPWRSPCDTCCRTGG